MSYVASDKEPSLKTCTQTVVYTITWKEKVIVPRHSKKQKTKKKPGPGREAETTSHHAVH